MPNLYAGLNEIKAAMPDGIRSTTTKYDQVLISLSERVSRFVDMYCRRYFYPRLETRYYSSVGEAELWIDDLVELTTLEYSKDEGASYTPLVKAGNFHLTVGSDYNDPRSATCLVVDANGALVRWPYGRRAVKVEGWWGYSDERAAAWDSSGVKLAKSYTAGGTTLEVTDVTMMDRWGRGEAFQLGRILRVGDEIFEVVGITNAESGNDMITVVGARNGSTSANHAKDDMIYLWQVPEAVKQATIIQAVRQYERGMQGFGDARANLEMGQLFFIKQIDPEAAVLLSAYRRHAL